MKQELITESNFSYWEKGSGQPLILLHGLMGDLSNLVSVLEYFSSVGYRVIVPKLPIYTLPIINTNVKSLVTYLKDFIEYKKFDEVVLFGNSLGGHVALYFTKHYPELVKALVLTGSSGLYEKSLGNTYPKRGNKDYIRSKVQEVFYDPNVASEELIETVIDTVNDRGKVIRTLALAKSAIRHNMAKDLPTFTMPTCIIWGRNDKVTPPEVGDEFHKLLPNSDLFWIDKCGHAAMMEHPKEFNRLLHNWLDERKI